ncbi:Os03g0782150 [Oryza sativa Japonica Group]|uniref:Os03g0782150 protein n=1 Tax=Oryza sativa subsp. japonica TaxID=39947 RepID=A0A0P0W4G0_ORYSJ|nr:Os03g0782150 [Oryza sativa Japonica Group]
MLFSTPPALATHRNLRRIPGDMAIHLLLGDVTVRKASDVGSTPPRRSDLSSRAVVAPDSGASAKDRRAAAGGGSGVSATIEATEAEGGRPNLGGGGDFGHGWRTLAENWRGWEELAERWDDGQEAAKKLAGRQRIHVGGVSWSADTGGGRGGMLLTFLPIDIQVIATCYSVDMQVLK